MRLFQRKRFWTNLLTFAVASVILAIGTTVHAQDAATLDDVSAVQVGVDSMWILVTAFIVFFMQAGFSLLEAGSIRTRGVVNSLLENFMDAAMGGLIFFAIGYGIAFGTSQGGLFGTSNFFLSDAMAISDGAVDFGPGVSAFVLAFFQFAFCATAGTIATGAMAERTHFIGKIIYTLVVAGFIYPVVVHWTWGGGILTGMDVPFLDFAGSTIVHLSGAIIGLVGTLMLGPRMGRKWGSPPAPHNLGFAALGAMILWFGWYGFNPGSALGMGNNGLVGLVTINTTLSGAAAASAALLFVYFRSGKWNLPAALNGALGGLVGITAGCAFVSPTSSVIIGVISGFIVILTVDLFERLKIDDPVGAFAVHGACGIFGTLAVGIFGIPELGAAGILMGGGASQLVSQVIGVVIVTAWVGGTSTVMFFVIKALGVLRISTEGENLGIDQYEHGQVAYTTSDIIVPATAAGD